MSFVIAVDGLSVAGKGTLARGLSAQYGFPHLDSGELYRAVARSLMDAGGSEADPDAVRAAAAAVTLDSVGGRSPQVSRVASRVACHKDVRCRVNGLQRDFAAAHGAVVVDGRDIGTVVFPQAQVKFFVVASEAVRVRRQAARWPQMSLDEITRQLVARDTRDTQRPLAPLRPAQDAHLIDTTDLSIEAMVRAAREISDPVVAAFRAETSS